MDELVDGAEEELLGDLDFVGLLAELRADTDELLHAALHAQVGHLTIELARTQAALEDIAENERSTAPPMIGSTGHEVESNVEGVDIGIIAVVDERAPVLARFHLQSHGHRLKALHAVGQLLGRESQIQGHGSTADGVLHRGVVDERQFVAALYTFIYIYHLRRRIALDDIFDEKGSLGVGARPGDALALEFMAGYAGRHDSIVLAIDSHLSIMEEFELLFAFRFHRGEVLLMGITYVGEHGDGRLNDVAQCQHLSRHTDTRLEESHLGLFVEEPN